MTESKEIRTMRGQAWARAKGELESMLCTYYGGDETYDRYLILKEAKELFIATIEDQGVHE